MKNKHKHMLLALGLLIVLALGLLFSHPQADVRKESISRSIEEIDADFREFLHAHPGLLQQLPTFEDKFDTKGSEVLATVNGWPLTVAELEFYRGMTESFGREIEMKSTFNYLIREKAELALAEELGVLPTKEELTASLAAQQANEEEMAGHKMLYTSFGITEEEYWQIHQRYYEYRFLAQQNLWNALMDKKYSEAKYDTDGQDYYRAEVVNYLKKAKIERYKVEGYKFKLIRNKYCDYDGTVWKVKRH